MKQSPHIERPRIEYSLRNPGTVSSLDTIANPFEHMPVYDPRRLAMSYGEQIRTAALLVGQDRGRRRILRLFPKQTHPTVLAALAKCSSPQEFHAWSGSDAWQG